jgi:hypothetical protein
VSDLNSRERTAEVCRRCDLSQAALKLAVDPASSVDFVERLTEQGLYADAVQFLAHWLPAREAVWWGCLCLWLVVRPRPAPEITAALEAALRWVQAPTQEHCRVAEKAGDAAGLGTPAGCIAMAAFWSGNSLAPPSLPKVAPDATLPAVGVAGAVQLAAVQAEPDQVDERFCQFVDIGIDVARGKNRWE